MTTQLGASQLSYIYNAPVELSTCICLRAFLGAFHPKKDTVEVAHEVHTTICTVGHGCISQQTNETN